MSRPTDAETDRIPVTADSHCPNTMMLVGAALAGASGKGITRLAKQLAGEPEKKEQT